MSSPSISRALMLVRLLGLSLACLGPVAAYAQASGPSIPPVEQPPIDDRPVAPPAPGTPSTPPQNTPAAESVRAATASSLGSPANTAVETPRGRAALGPRPGVVTVSGTGQAAGGGTRVLKAPAACTPKTNSLDCVAEAGQAGQGANVSSRVRNSVIGEVGAGRAATEGAGAAKREGPCTPQAGKLTCD